MASRYKSIYDAADAYNNRFNSIAPIDPLGNPVDQTVINATKTNGAKTNTQQPTSADSNPVVYSPSAAYAQAAKAAADSTYNYTLAQADQARAQSIADAQNAYRNARPTYGANAEKYLASGLRGSGISDYAAASAYAAMRGEIANANAVNAYAQQNALYNRDQAYAQADAYQAQTEQTVYNNLLSSVMSGSLNADMIDGVAAAYGLQNQDAIGALKNAAGLVSAYTEKQQKAAQENLQKAYDYIMDNGITDAEQAAKVASQLGYSEGSDAYAALISAAENNAARTKTVQDAGKVAWSAEDVDAYFAGGDDFTVNIGGKDYKLNSVSEAVVKDQNLKDRLNEMATGDKTKKPTVKMGDMNSNDNAGAIQVLDGKMYIYHPKSKEWREVRDRDKKNTVENAIKAWNNASAAGKFANYSKMTESEKENFIASVFNNENTKGGIDSLAAELKEAGIPEESITKAVSDRKKEYSARIDKLIPDSYKGEPTASAYKDHLEDLKDDLISDEQKAKIRAAFVKNQGLNGLRKIFEEQIKNTIRYDSTGKLYNGYTSNAPLILSEKGGLKGLYASLGYEITDQQAKDLEMIYRELLNPPTAEEYASQLNRKR